MPSTRAVDALRALRLPALLFLGACVRTPEGSTAARPAVASVQLDCDTTSADPDGDGLSESCELAMARAFAPLLQVDRDDCLWSATNERLRGGYLFAVQPTNDGARLAYLPAYEEDCGWSGASCWFRGARCSGHAGDSEAIALDLTRRDDRWRVSSIYISAHCGHAVDDRCQWMRESELHRFVWDTGGAAPVVWVAKDKHAHYATRSACERGSWRRERCARDPSTVRFPVTSEQQNIGARGRSRFGAEGCIVAHERPIGAQGMASGLRECIWLDTASFRGWQSRHYGPPPRPYGAILRDLGFE